MKALEYKPIPWVIRSDCPNVAHRFHHSHGYSHGNFQLSVYISRLHSRPVLTYKRKEIIKNLSEVLLDLIWINIMFSVRGHVNSLSDLTVWDEEDEEDYLDTERVN
jgi:hypothetical protein